ncbi:Abi-alpha family protein [Photobacterium leiognathi]|uniref:Abi-alpha family protein n=1 Tax=Photobacterium leiognathi TaxID=553611 RepID=UPI002981CDDF|nr:Abi-alpha family protein [Photobacterium leiognathi]
MELLEKIALERSKDFYDDAISPSAKKAGEAIETLTSLFSDVLLYPVKTANENFKCKYKIFKHELSKKMENIPQENTIEPSLIISGPALENLKYAFDEKHLRNMYLDLLSNAMDS